MQKRKFGKLDLECSLLGFGCMRFPTIENPDPDSEFGDIDSEQAINLVRYAIDHGVDYIDTAYPYHGGKSEVLVGKALQDGYRDRIKLATKLPIWNVKERADCDKILAEQLERLQTDAVDFYLLHALNQENWQKVKQHDVLEFMDEAKSDGRIKYAGFSFHDNIGLFKEIVDAYEWDFCQIQLNYMDEDYQAGVEGLKYAADKGLAVVIMEPLRGGKLARNIPGEVQNLWDNAPVKRTAADWAFRWLANQPEVSVILSGMGGMPELEENIATLTDAQVNSLSATELSIIDQAKQFYNERTKVKCTDCRYCLPCPQGVAIPRIFGVYNNASIYNAPQEGKWQYSHILKDEQDAEKCIACGQCEDVCPQNLQIIELLAEAHGALA